MPHCSQGVETLCVGDESFKDLIDRFKRELPCDTATQPGVLSPAHCSAEARTKYVDDFKTRIEYILKGISYDLSVDGEGMFTRFYNSINSSLDALELNNTNWATALSAAIGEDLQPGPTTVSGKLAQIQSEFGHNSNAVGSIVRGVTDNLGGARTIGKDATLESEEVMSAGCGKSTWRSGLSF